MLGVRAHAVKVSVTGRSVCLINALTQTGTWNQSPLLTPPSHVHRMCVRAFRTLCLQRGWWWVLGRRHRWDEGLGAEEKKGVCSRGNNRWTCSGGYGVSLITHRPHLLICSNYLPTQWAPCQQRGVNTTDQIHLKIKVPTHSTTPTRAFYGGLTTLKSRVCVCVCGREGLHV